MLLTSSVIAYAAAPSGISLLVTALYSSFVITVALTSYVAAAEATVANETNVVAANERAATKEIIFFIFLSS
ncbi:MAG: hypothetical protein J6C82_00015 [Clostridia bacterium]|nr:hypothetical protein [Clostridia bacterium]